MTGAVKAEAPILSLMSTQGPTAKQREFWEARESRIAFGGARGGGKSWAARRKLVMMCFRYPNLRALLLRRTMQDLRENHIRTLRKELAGAAQYKADERAFLFGNGSLLKLGYCDNDNDCLQYQGQEYDVICFEEATQMTEQWLTDIAVCARGKRGDLKTRIYYTCNPGGPGHAYIKRLFVDGRRTKAENAFDWRFIRSFVQDNPHLDIEYTAFLETLPPARKRAWLEGDWNIFEGQVFEEFRDVPEHYDDRRWTHVIAPFDIPKSWPVYRSFDWGWDKPFSVGWWAVDNDKRIYRIREWYGCRRGEPDRGVHFTNNEILDGIIEREQMEPLRGRKIVGIADPAIRKKENGISFEDDAHKKHVNFIMGDHTRIAGWAQVHQRLRFDEDGLPMMYIFSTCEDFIRTVPLLQYDKNRAEDVDSDGEDHIADETRYFCMYRPMGARAAVTSRKGWSAKQNRLYDNADAGIKQELLRKWGSTQ
jgi:PBSX family phage terminase large subunit